MMNVDQIYPPEITDASNEMKTLPQMDPHIVHHKD